MRAAPSDPQPTGMAPAGCLTTEHSRDSVVKVREGRGAACAPESHWLDRDAALTEAPENIEKMQNRFPDGAR